MSAAHTVHIDGGTDSSPFSCSECHTLYTSLSHESPTAVITFATVSGDIANLGGLTPSWSASTTTCSSVYCHGNGAAPVSGTDGGTLITITDGALTSPDWSKTDGSQAQCNSCHGNPPVANSHIQCTKDFCNVCHTNAVQGGDFTTGNTLHVNGVIDVMPEESVGSGRARDNHAASWPSLRRRLQHLRGLPRVSSRGQCAGAVHELHQLSRLT